MSVTHLPRRALLSAGAHLAGTVALCTVLPRPLFAQFEAGGTRQEPAPPVTDPRVKSLVLRGVDSARSAGAEYADVRLTHTIARILNPQDGRDQEWLHAGVRALVKGYWGFASGPVWGADELARLGREAARQAQTNALGLPREIDLGSIATVQDGHWMMPVEIDPLSVHPLAIRDYLGGLERQISHDADPGAGFNISATAGCQFVVQERAFGATTGSYCTQRFYRTSGNVGISISRGLHGGRMGRTVDLLSPAGVGWELFLGQPIRDTAIRIIHEALPDFALPVRPVDVGRYTLALSASSVAEIVSPTIGAATELDRALGYEANAGGTSYLTDPFGMQGTFVLGTPQLTVTANRSARGSVATVQWDDEGVVPEEFTVVERGIIRDYHTTREGAGWLAGTASMKTRTTSGNGPGSSSAASSRAQRSHGCAYAPSGCEAPLAHTANLVMTPGDTSLQVDDLIKGVTNGIALFDMRTDMDFQQLNGYAGGRAYEIRNGKRVAQIANLGVLFRAPEFWKSLIAMGGKDSAQRYGLWAQKGEPSQTSYHSVTAVPAVFRDQSIIDITRSA